MKRCPITYDMIDDNMLYSKQGLYLLSPRLHELQPLAFNADEQRKQAIANAGKMSVQGVQTKLSAQLKITEGRFKIVDQYGHYILKPQNENYPELPENEALTMSLAAYVGIDVPIHGLVYSKDNSMTYFVKRFDRIDQRLKKKLAVEDFAQLLNFSRETKYRSSMEKVIDVVESFCTFPKIEFVKLFKLTLFNFLIGNEDMHLKNFSLITRTNITSLSPAYDLLNSTIAQPSVKKEIALPLNGKKRNLRASDFFNYLAIQRLGLNAAVIAETIKTFEQALPLWQALIQKSFLSESMQARYLQLLNERWVRLMHPL